MCSLYASLPHIEQHHWSSCGCGAHQNGSIQRATSQSSPRIGGNRIVWYIYFHPRARAGEPFTLNWASNLWSAMRAVRLWRLVYMCTRQTSRLTSRAMIDSVDKFGRFAQTEWIARHKWHCWWHKMLGSKRLIVVLYIRVDVCCKGQKRSRLVYAFLIIYIRRFLFCLPHMWREIALPKQNIPCQHNRTRWTQHTHTHTLENTRKKVSQ